MTHLPPHNHMLRIPACSSTHCLGGAAQVTAVAAAPQERAVQQSLAQDWQGGL